MSHAEKTKEQLLNELEELRRRNDALEAAAAEWKRDKESLLESEQNFKAVADNANDGILIAAGKGTHVYANQRAAEITGHSVSELLEATIKDLAHPGDFPEIMSRYRRIVDGKPFPRQYDTRIVKKDGETIPVEVASARTVWRGQPADIVLLRDITERKRTEEVLRESEERYRLLVETMYEGFALANENYVFTHVNERFCEMLGYSRGELIEHHLIEFIHHDYRALMQDQMARRKKGEAKRFELAWTAKDGNKIYTLVSPRGYYDAEGCFKGSLGILADITDLKKAEEALQKAHDELERRVEERTAQLLRTNEQLKHEIEERKQAEEALRDAEEQYRSLVEHARDAIIIIQNEKTVYCNPMYEEVLGYSVNEAMDSSFLDLVVPEDRNLVKDHYYNRLERESPLREFEVGVMTRSGRLVTMEVKLDLIEYKGEPATMVVMRDITERKEAEEALRQSEERFRTIFEKSRDAICVINEDGHYLMVNEAMCGLTGVSRQDLTGEHYSTFMDEETHELTEIYRILRKRNDSIPDRYEFKLIRPDGDIRIVENVPSVIQLPDKGSLTLAILRDVTERRQMEDALESMRSRLLNLQESERGKLSRVLHDTIGQNISILDFNITTIEEVLDQTSRQQISSLIDNMRGIIRETGDKLRDISGGLHPRLIQELGLVEGISSFIDRFRRTTNLKVEASILGDHLEVEDSVAVNIYRIIQEAFTNIVKHAKSSLVLFDLKIENDCLLVMIKDDGTGFSLADVSQREIDQRGMGLFIMAERVKAIGGKLQINSEPDQGTELRVEVDLAAWSIEHRA